MVNVIKLYTKVYGFPINNLLPEVLAVFQVDIFFVHISNIFHTYICMCKRLRCECLEVALNNCQECVRVDIIFQRENISRSFNSNEIPKCVERRFVHIFFSTFVPSSRRRSTKYEITTVDEPAYLYNLSKI